MKIEKISDNQIRCTLTKEDLATRHLKISELAYGTEKAKSLFRDMMQQAAYEFGFEANDIPLMIEAIPPPTESLVLINTKVQDPEELDTRFAKCAPFTGKNGAKHSNSPISSPIEGADDILGLFNKIREAHKQAVEKQAPAKPSPEDAAKAPVNLTRLYKFDRLDTVILAAGILGPIYHGENSLYKDAGSKEYHLLISKSDHSPEEFNKICNILSEYGRGFKFSSGMDAFYAEHMECLVSQKAIQKLSGLSQ